MDNHNHAVGYIALKLTILAVIGIGNFFRKRFGKK